jgi:hypothetical protein
VLEKVAMEQVFLPALPSFSVIIIPQILNFISKSILTRTAGYVFEHLTKAALLRQSGRIGQEGAFNLFSFQTFKYLLRCKRYI